MNIESISSFLARLVLRSKLLVVPPLLRYCNGAVAPCARLHTAFNSVTVPPITVQDYVKRLIGNESSRMIEGALACLFIQRLLTQHECSFLWGWGVTENNVHRLFLTSLLVATKYATDSPSRKLLSEMAVRGGVSPHELAHLEVALLALLNFRLFVPTSDYEAFVQDNSVNTAAIPAVVSHALTKFPSSPITPPHDDYHLYHYNNNRINITTATDGNTLSRTSPRTLLCVPSPTQQEFMQKNCTAPFPL